MLDDPGNGAVRIASPESCDPPPQFPAVVAVRLTCRSDRTMGGFEPDPASANPLLAQLQKWQAIPPGTVNLPDSGSQGSGANVSEECMPAEPPAGDIDAAVRKFARLVTDALVAGADGNYEATVDTWI